MDFLTNVSNAIQNFVENQLGTAGASALGWFLIAVGIIGMFWSIAAHVMNQQSRMMKWYWWLLVAGLGGSILGGIAWVIVLIKQIGETIKGLFGV